MRNDDDVTRLGEVLHELVARYPVPGAGIGVLRDGVSRAVLTGVTSVENPLELDRGTLLQIGSVSKTYTATAVMRLVASGRIGLDDPVRAHLPELRLADERVAEAVTVRHLLNHTAGWDGTLSSGGDAPDETLSWFVASRLPDLEQVGGLGARVEYNNAAVALAGHLVERVCGERFEDAIRHLLLEPLHLDRTRFSGDDLMTERVAVGHIADGDGHWTVARPWRWPRAGDPEGGLVSTLFDQLAWARFHLGDGRAPDGTVLLDRAHLEAMRTPTAELVGNVMGEAIGLGWFLRDVGGQRTVGHQGTTNGQFCELRLVPDADYAVVAYANGGPAGTGFVAAAIDRLLADDLGLHASPRRYRDYDPDRDGDVAGLYENSLSRIEVTVEDGGVIIRFAVRPEVAEQLSQGANGFSPSPVRFVEGDRGEYVVTGGDFDGTTGSFARDARGRVTELDFGGRWNRRTDHT